ncbi:MAG TPA: OsmC family protein [Bryobacteraceae bacterium]|nr:OsmC family protein [Bryobacteraceae bacterium]
MKDSHASVHWGGNGFFIGISPSGHAITIDIDGERSSAPSPMELLMVALGGCTGGDVVSILEKKRLRVTDYRIEVRGERRKEHPRAFKKLEVRHILLGEGLRDDAVKQAVRLSTNTAAWRRRGAAEIVANYVIENGRG